MNLPRSGAVDAGTQGKGSNSVKSAGERLLV